MKLLLAILLWTLLSQQAICRDAAGISNGENMFGIFKKTDPIEDFWKWFSGKEKYFRNFHDDPDKYLNELLIEALKIEKGLAIELQWPQNGVINMTISADGDKNLFPVVQKIIEKAPKIEGWTFLAFRQRMPIEQVKQIGLKVQGIILDPGEMKFQPLVESDTLDVIVYLQVVTEENYNEIAYACFIILDKILGEYDCVMKVRNYDFHPLPTDQTELEELKPLIDLAGYVDTFYARKN